MTNDEIQMTNASGAPTTGMTSNLPVRRGPLRAVAVLLIGLTVYFVISYLLMPALWRVYSRRHPALKNLPDITFTHDGHAGDPINLALIAAEGDLKASMLSAGWHVADPLSWRSDLKIAADTVLKRPYDDAPVSNLYLWDHKENLAFEQPVGGNPRERHHVRFWKSTEVDDGGRPLWAGAATFDQSVGFSHTTGQITHHIAADVDTERDHVAKTLAATGRLSNVELIEGFHKSREGHNGGGDAWHTDGSLWMATIGRLKE
jgi:hypothetical protein